MGCACQAMTAFSKACPAIFRWKEDRERSAALWSDHVHVRSLCARDYFFEFNQKYLSHRLQKRNGQATDTGNMIKVPAIVGNIYVIVLIGATKKYVCF